MIGYALLHVYDELAVQEIKEMTVPPKISLIIYRNTL